MQDEVYVLMEVYTDAFSDTPNEYPRIYGIYESRERAISERDVLAANEFDFAYWVEPYRIIKG